MPSALINLMTDAAFKAAKGMLRDFGEVDKLQISRKGTANFVTNADKKAEKMIMEMLKIGRPDFSFLMEESGEIVGKDQSKYWVIDPLDGTHNFIHAIPYFCISIALEERKANGEREVLAGVVYDPIHQEMFAAEKGAGAFVNERRIFVSKRVNTEEAMVVMSSPRSRITEPMTSINLLEKVLVSNASVRFMGASALDLCQLAAGRFDAVCLQAQLPWDVAAGALIVREAGGYVSQINGTAFSPHDGNVLATNKLLHPALLKLLAEGAGKN